MASAKRTPVAVVDRLQWIVMQARLAGARAGAVPDAASGRIANLTQAWRLARAAADAAQ